MSNLPAPKHSYLPASACERWWNCPGSAKAAADNPSQASIYTAEGTVAHSLVHYALLKDQTLADIEKYIGDVEPQDGFSIKITEEMVDAVWVMVQEVRRRISPSSVVWLEEKVNIQEINQILFATPDVVIIDPFEKITVIDFKYGAGKRVSAWENKQLMYYALATFLREDVGEVELVIVQPRTADEDVKSFSASPLQMKTFYAELKLRVAEALKKDAPRVAGPWCRSTFCPVFATCDAAREFAQRLVADDFKNPPPVSALNLKQIKEVLDAADFLTGWIEKVKDHAKEMILQGETLPGYKLIRGYGHRKFKSEESIVADFARLGEAMYEKSLKSPAKIEKLLTKEEKELFEDYTYRPESAPRLVPEDHKGEAISGVSAIDDFSKP